MGFKSGTYRSPLRPFFPRRGPGNPHASGMQGGTPEQRQETRNPSRSRRPSRTPPPAAWRVVFHEEYKDGGNGGPNDPNAQRASSTADPRGRSKRLHTKQAHIPTIPMPAEREQQAALHLGPCRAADGASSSSATSLPGLAAGPLPRTARHGHAAKGTRGRPEACASGGRTNARTPPPASGAQ